MQATSFSLTLADLDATQTLAQRLAPCLAPGWVILLDGPIGAGKSAFARAVIHALQDVPEDVPSPTFTLVQTYETRAGDLWHADLYRLNGPDGVDELGLWEAMDHAICLIEWPDRLTAPPANAVTLTLTPTGQGDTRRATFSGPKLAIELLQKAALS